MPCCRAIARGAIISGVTPAAIGRYRVIELVGQGAMGTVFRCRDERLERDVAVKVMSVAHSAEPDARARFAREARAAARLQHANIITIYELGEQSGTPFIAMEYLDGIDLQRAITAGIRPDPRVTLPIVLQILAGLAHAHEHGIVHRDIKPSNLFLPRGRPAKIMDFGVARLTSAPTTAGVIVGTPNYMSPEQVKGGTVDGRSDLFSTALILYELVTGERAFTGGSVVAVLYRIANERPDLSLLPHAPEWAALRRVVTRALAQNPQERYPDAPAMAAELVQSLADLGGSPDWATASDRGLVARHAPRLTPPPTRRPAEVLAKGAAAGVAKAPQPVEQPPAAGEVRPVTEQTTHRAGVPWPWLVAVLIGISAVALVVAAVVLSSLRRPGRTVFPTPEPSVATGAPSIVAMPAGEVVSTPTPVASPRREPAPTPVVVPRQASSSASPKPAASPSSPAHPTFVPGAASARLARANALLEARHYQSALTEAQAVLARQPDNEEARTIAEDAAAALLVEDKLRGARAALDRGDRKAALAEVRAGLVAAPNDARLLALSRQLAH
jgi:predicted Ser/Thr protein kinase